eukprot:TRINITY_DN3854_c3_g1_i1.p1 TRINITY_DN3854_c3_g1~~TRINITY_DN3854_c3_g1_i1.p1  ORF type:complete len:2094 (+),score=318.99 TRINITY_DN3854_c3_g1_i1:61-6342(+)
MTVEGREVESEGEDDVSSRVPSVVVTQPPLERKVLGLAARAVCVQCLNLRLMKKPEDDKSFFFLRRDSELRIKISHLIRQKYFTGSVLVLIIINSVTLALDSPDNKDNDDLQSFLYISEIVFVSFFGLEAVLKIAALSFFGSKTSYSSNWWNLLDFLIVVVGLANLILPAIGGISTANVSAIRLLRILRPLRTVSRIKGMRSIIQTLLLSLPSIGDVFLLLLFLLLVFAIAGIQLWSNTLHRRCFTDTTFTELFPNDTTACSPMPTGVTCPLGSFCGVNFDEYNVRFLNFNHMGAALLFVFKIISLDDWPEDMWLVQDTYLHIVWLYFIILVLTSSYFAVNLFLAVLSAIFTGNEADAQVEMLRKGHRINAVVGLLQGPFKVPEDVELVRDQSPDELETDTESMSSSSSDELKVTRKTVLSEGDRQGSMGRPPIRPMASFNRYNVILRDTGALVLSGPRQHSALLRKRLFIERRLSATPKQGCLKRRSSASGQLVHKPEPLSRQGCLRLLSTGITEVESVESNSKKSNMEDGSTTWSVEDPDTPTLGNNNSLANVKHTFTTGQGITLEVPTSPVRLPQCKSADIYRDHDTGFLNVTEAPRRRSSPAAPGQHTDERKKSICPLDEGELNRLPKLAGMGGFHNLGYDELTSPVSISSVNLDANNINGNEGAGHLSPTSTSKIISPSHSSGSELVGHVQPCVPLLNLPGLSMPEVEPVDTDSEESLPQEAPTYGGVTWRRRRKTKSYSVVAGSIIPPQWEVAEGQSAFMSVEPAMEEPCTADDSERVLQCRRTCLRKGYGGFAIYDGKALYRDETGEECRSMLIPEENVTFHLVTLWEEVVDHDAFPNETSHEEKVGEIGLEECVHECIKSGYGGFSVKNGTACFKNRSSQSCREALQPSPGTRFYVIKGEVGYRIKVRALVMHPTFEKVFLAVTIINVIVLGTDHYGIEDDMVTAIEIINTICTVLFIIEIVLKIVGLGWRLTFRDPYNRFDAFLCLVGLPQLILNFALSSDGGGGNVLSIFRMLRVARVLRLGRRWVRLRNTIWIVAESISAVAYLSLLLLLLLFIYCVLGMQLFGESLASDTSRLNFSSLWRSLLTVFVVVTGEGWVKVMRSTMEATSWTASFYFVSLFVMGRYIILNLFIAIIIEKFQNKKTDELLNQTDHEEKDWETTVASENAESADGSDACTEAPKTERRVRSVFELKLQGDSSPKHVSQTMDASGDNFPDYESSNDDAPSNSSATRRPSGHPSRASEEEADQDELSPASPIYFGEKTCGCLSASNPLRKALTPIITSTTFDRSIVALIVLNLCLLASENPETRKDFSDGFYFADLSFTVIFVVEMVAKIIVFGIWKAPHAYLRDLWNCVDFVVVLTSLLGLFVPTFQLTRSFRVFRLVIRSENAKVVLYATVGSISSVMNGLAVCGFLFILFAIMGVQIFKGSFVTCTDTTIIHKSQCNGTFINDLGVEEEARWKTLDYSFDHLGAALFTLFKVALSERWVDIMFVAMDSDNDVIGPEIDKRPIASLYFVLFFIFANFLCLNLIISILISTFSAYHEARFVRIHAEETQQDELYAGVGVWKADIAKFEMMRHRLLTDGQKKWVRSQQLLVQDIYYKTPPDDKKRRYFYKLVESDKFEWSIAGVIVLNLMLLCTQHRVPSSQYLVAFDVLNYIFIVIYVGEFAVKVYAYTFTTFWRDNWNRFDMVVLVVSLCGIFVGESLTFFRVFRVGRVLRLFHMSKGLAKMFTALLYALPPLFNIGILLACVFFVFGVLGVDLYGEIDLDLNPYLNRNFNFRNLGEAILLLFQISTGELWLDALEGVRVEAPYCEQNCGSDVAIPYFVVFMVVVSFLMVNLFVAVVLEAFQDAEQVLSNDSLITAFHKFRESWLSVTYELDHDQDEMDVDQFLLFIREIPPPLGPLFKTDGFLLKLLKDLNIPVDTNLRVRYEHVIHGLARKVFRITHEEALELSHLSHVMITDEMFTVAHVHCVRKIARIWREHVAARLAGENREESEPEPEFLPFTAFNVPAEGRLKHRGSDFLGSTYGNSNELGDTGGSNGMSGLGLGHKKQSSFMEELHKRSSKNLIAARQASRMLRPPSIG